MKERPILFSGEMVRAILDGRKTVTRRVVKAKHIPFIEKILGGYLDGKWNQRPMPYGQPGDRLWVRETWRPTANCKGYPEGFLGVEYRSDGETRATGHPREPFVYVSPLRDKWRPSIHMPRWASRIMLEVTGVRVERLQEITEKGARAEGCHGMGSNGDAEFPPEGIISAVEDFRDLWDSINESRGFGWDKNPWVWVVEFKRVV